MRSALVAVTIALLASAAVGADARNTFVSKDHGVSIEAPYIADAPSAVQQVVIFFLPAADGFSANVNVQKQKFAAALKDYDALSMAQFEQLKLTVVKHAAKEDEIIYEYQGEMQGRAFHWYSRALRGKDCVCLATATALESRWEKEGPALKQSVDSFATTK